MFEWKCTICGEIIESNEVPSQCPVCGVGSELFVKIEKEDSFNEFNDEFKIVIIGASGAGMSAYSHVDPVTYLFETTEEEDESSGDETVNFKIDESRGQME